MRTGAVFALVLAVAALAGGSREALAAPVPAGMAAVGKGTLRPLYPPSADRTTVEVEAFVLDRAPVTNAQFLRFVQANERWRRDRVSRLFADERYLSHWAAPDALGDAGPDDPVTRVSWFAAKAYCQAQGKRLATEREWEYAAQASETEPDASGSVERMQEILGWYGRPTPKTPGPVAQKKPNYWGVHDLHGLVWEWVLDFNSTLLRNDSRESKDSDRFRFCGSGALSARDKEDYASFMRIAFRSSLEANYTAASLGFRCAADAGGSGR